MNETDDTQNVPQMPVKDSVADKVVEYLLRSCTEEAGLSIFQRINRVPGHKISGKGDPHRKIILIDDLQLILEKASDLNDTTHIAQ